MQIELQNLTVRNENKTIFADVSLKCEISACGIFGPSGAGKSTFLAALFNYLTNEFEVSGKIIFKNKFSQVIDLQKGCDVYFILQDAQNCFDPNRKLKVQLQESIEKMNYQGLEVKVKMQELLQQLGLAEEILNKFPKELSGGMLQRCAVGLALISKASIIVADEPTSSLDSENKKIVIKMMRQLRDEGKVILYTTHDLEELKAICTEIIVVNNQQINYSDDITSINDDYVRKVSKMQQKLQGLTPGILPIQKVMLVDFANVSKSFKGRLKQKTKTVIKDFNLQINKQENIAIMGPSGVGKTTLIKLLLQQLQPTNGVIEYNKVTKFNVVFQNSKASVDPFYTCKQVLLEAKEQATAAEIRKILQDVGLDENILSQRARTLSGGELQRLCIARAIISGANIIVFDEAFSSLDMINLTTIIELLLVLATKYQLTYFVVTHNLAIAKSLCHKIIYLDEQNKLSSTFNVT